MAFAGCAQKEGPQAEDDSAQLTINVKSDMSTKASGGYTDALDYERMAKKISVFVYDASGDLVAEETLSSSSSSTSMNILTGKKTVVAVVNLDVPSANKQSLSDLENMTINLGSNSIVSGFVMYGKKNCTVTSGSNSVTVTVSRLASRVALRSITNGLASSLGNLTVKYAFLSNVVSEMCLGGGEPVGKEWINQEGRKDESPRVSSHKIDGTSYTASLPSLTASNINSTVANGSSYSPSTPQLMYCYQNYETAEPDGFHSSFAPQRTVLVVYAGYGGAYYWYPIVLNSGTIDPNTAYTVDLTITGPGSNDPNIPVSKGSVDTSIDIAPWNPGDIYDESI